MMGERSKRLKQWLKAERTGGEGIMFLITSAVFVFFLLPLTPLGSITQSGHVWLGNILYAILLAETGGYSTLFLIGAVWNEGEKE